MKKEADHVIIVSHIGVDKDRDREERLGIDLIIGAIPIHRFIRRKS